MLSKNIMNSTPKIKTVETAISHLTILPLTKKEQQSFYQQIKNEIANGNANPLHLKVVLKAVSDTIKMIDQDEDIKFMTLKEADKYSEKTFDAYGCKISLSNRKTFDYSECNDSVYNSLVATFEATKEEIKKREEFLKAIPNEGTVNPETGELITAPKFTTSEIITVKF